MLAISRVITEAEISATFNQHMKFIERLIEMHQGQMADAPMDYDEIMDRVDRFADAVCEIVGKYQYRMDSLFDIWGGEDGAARKVTPTMGSCSSRPRS
jgi:hypothetical protein